MMKGTVVPIVLYCLRAVTVLVWTQRVQTLDKICHNALLQQQQLQLQQQQQQQQRIRTNVLVSVMAIVYTSEIVFVTNTITTYTVTMMTETVVDT
jgi:hypothetical protein